MMVMVMVREAGQWIVTGFIHNHSDSNYRVLVSAAHIKKCMSLVTEAIDLHSEHETSVGSLSGGLLHRP